MLVVGAGALGGAAALELAALGFRRLAIADDDRVELSNLPRQLLSGAADLGRPKVDAIRDKLARAGVDATVHRERFGAESAARIAAGHDVWIDATDDPATKFLLNDLAVASGTPLVHAGVAGLEGQLTTVPPGGRPCLRCLFPAPPAEGEAPACREAGVLGPLAGIVGALQAREAAKWLRGEGTPLAGRLLAIDLRVPRIRELRFRPAADCPACGSEARPGLVCSAGSKETT